MSALYTILSLGHPVTDAQVRQLSKLLGVDNTDKINAVHVPRRYDMSPGADISAQVLAHLQAVAEEGRVDLTKSDEAARVILFPPGVSVAVALTVAAFHGLAGFFPNIAMLGRRADGFSVIEVVILDVAHLAATTS